jgi:glycosyltransferase involved in cell wall biosynthesis/predicted O-methyltransferase YrrM
MSEPQNIFACLVHESQECVVDLVRNLRYLDPDSTILLYNGGQDPGLLERGFRFERWGAVAHPRPRPLAWGKLHDFALDCMRFALESLPFDTLTIVDSDQLAAGPGYSRCLATSLTGRPGIGMLGSAPGRQSTGTDIGPAAAAYREIDLWRPYLRRFPHGEEKFLYWTFWPTTVFTADAARDLTYRFARDRQLEDLMRHSRIWATEEVILPTLVALLGYEVAANPCSYDYVKFRRSYSAEEIRRAIARSDVHWVHPVPRHYGDPRREQIREHFGHYRRSAPAAGSSSMAETGGRAPRLLLTAPILARMRTVPGWLEDEEADLLIAAMARILDALPGYPAIVEVGSYCGRSTVVLGSVVRDLGRRHRVCAIDPREGKAGALDRGIRTGSATLVRLRANLAAAGLTETVEVVRKRSYEVRWQGPIGLLFIDGLHDYANVARDFFHFEPWVATGGYVAFHDYADYYPGVRVFVDELLAAGGYRKVHRAGSLVVIEKLRATPAAITAPHPEPVARPIPARAWTEQPRVSCIMPTCDRRAFVPQAIAYFLRQDYPGRELIVVDDGDDSVEDLMPSDPRVRYLRLPPGRTLGEKRNLACDEAAGEIIVHWDDDDWMAEHRIRYQVECLREGKADVCGLGRLYFYDPAAGAAWEYACPRRDKTWLAGGTFCYRKSFWRSNPFPATDRGEDTRFLWSDRAKHLLTLADPTFYVAVLHPHNTTARRTSGPGWRPLDVETVHRLLGNDRSFYRDLLAPPRPASAGAPGRPARASRQRAPRRPLVSCVMPTRDRRRFVPQAIRCFLRQDYPDRELVILDDGPEPVGELIPEDKRIRYLRLTEPLSLGEKRNLGVERSRGEIIASWDDDDWYASDRLSAQVQLLLAGDAQVSGLRAELFYDLRTGKLWRLSSELHRRMFFADVHGRSMAFRREVYDRGARYSHCSLGEDVGFLRQASSCGAHVAGMPSGNRLLCIRHGANTWSFCCGQFLDPTGWSAAGQPVFLPAEDLSFYRRLLAAADFDRGVGTGVAAQGTFAPDQRELTSS